MFLLNLNALKKIAFFAASVVIASTFVSFGNGQAPEKHVMVIGIDGAGGRYLQAANTPNIDALALGGGIRYDFLNEGGLIADPPATFGSSGVNWTTVNTGVSATSHGVTNNSFQGSNLANYPHWFKFVKDHDPSAFTASVVNWAPINDFLVPDDYADLKRQYTGESADVEDARVRDDVVNLLATGDPTAIFVHFDQVDQTGHAFSWGSPEYYGAIATVDGLVGDIVSSLDSRPGVRAGEEDWLVMVLADHGALEGSFIHSAGQGLSDWEVPFLISGPSVMDGVQFSQGTLRDVVPTALWHLGIDPSTTRVEGNVVGLTTVPEPSSGVIAWIGVLALLNFRRRSKNDGQ